MATRTLPSAMLIAVVLATACSENTSGNAGDSDDTGTTEDLPEVAPAFLVGGVLFNPDGETSYGTVVDRLAADVTVSLDQAVTLPGRASVAASPALDGTFFVGAAESPTISKYRIDDEGQISLEDELSLAGLGLTTAQGNQLNGLQVVAPDQAYLFDNATASVIRWNPETMTIEGEIPLDGLRIGQEPPALGFVVVDGETLVVAASYRRPDETADLLAAAAFLDTSTDAVSYATQTRCSNPVWAAKDAAGNIYYASHPAQGGRVVGDVAGDPPAPSCLTSIRQGTTTFDDAYFVDLVALAGRPAGALIQGVGDLAFTLVFDDPTVEVTSTNAGNLTLFSGWSYYSLQLGDEANTLRRVDTFERGSGIAIGFTVQEASLTSQTPFVIQVEPGFASGNLYDVASPTGFVQRMNLPGIPFGAFRIR